MSLILSLLSRMALKSLMMYQYLKHPVYITEGCYTSNKLAVASLVSTDMKSMFFLGKPERHPLYLGEQGESVLQVPSEIQHYIWVGILLQSSASFWYR
ncbi:unnamed protein product [Urochloa humidicola]